ncbi:hypothetical protein RF11_06501 [Thelohanellus kitauei]|uniref:Uncharacterized protein n=1 Tax=Thelohanellus kitauei TaxID=669202 RepID=A0A0C2JZU5_THEKT|nr:hypothetical protein RF11_06501 [Thelohanellus kitauei]
MGAFGWVPACTSGEHPQEFIWCQRNSSELYYVNWDLSHSSKGQSIHLTVQCGSFLSTITCVFHVSRTYDVFREGSRLLGRDEALGRAYRVYMRRMSGRLIWGTIAKKSRFCTNRTSQFFQVVIRAWAASR